MADPLPLTSAQVGGAMTAALMVAYANRGTFQGLLQAYTQNADLTAAIASGDMILPQGRTIAGGAITLAPTTAVANATPQAVVVTGTGFTPQSVVLVDGVAVATTYTSATSVTGTVPRAAAATKAIAVLTGQVLTPTQNFTVT